MRFLMLPDIQSLSPNNLPTIFPSRLIKKVVGWAHTPYALATCALSSINIGAEILNSALYFFRAFSLSLMATLRRTKSVPLNASASLAKEGDSFWHCRHHVWKKFKRMIFPLNSLREISFPPNSFSVKSGASTGVFNFWTPASGNCAMATGIFHRKRSTRRNTDIISLFIWASYLAWFFSSKRDLVFKLAFSYCYLEEKDITGTCMIT